MNVQGSTIIPSLRYHDAHAAIDWLVRVFGFRKQAIFEGPDHAVMHAQLTRRKGMLMLGSATNADTAYARHWIDVKETGGRETVGLCVIADSDDDCVAMYERVKAEGVEMVQELNSPEYGGKAFSCCDPEGHIWWVGSYNAWAEQPESVTGGNSMSANPYAGTLGRREPVEVITSTPDGLETLLGRMGAEKIERRSAPGKWNMREVVAHLADCEIAFGFRLRQGAAGVELVQPFDQDDWARNYAKYSLGAAMGTFRSLRAWNVAFVRSLSDEQRRLEINHPERGTMTVWTIVETMAGHDLHHLEGLQKSVA